ncbi:MAG: TIGR04086 family membrane protein [Clostridia bacterium]|nr:TIGR04086 family membrane protein [Clostridia bacterium]
MNWLAIVGGVVVSLSVLCLGLVGGAWWVLTLWEREMYLAGYLNSLFYLTVWAGGIIAGYRAKSLPWRHGAIAGCCYAILLQLVGWLLAPTWMNGQPAVKPVIICLLMGALAGVVGQNLRKASKRRRRYKALRVQKF